MREALLVAVVALALTSGCATTALDRTERVYGVLHAVQSETVGRFEERIRERVREDCPTGEESCALGVAALHRPAGEGLDVSADALDSAGRELIRWALDGAEEMPPATCVRIREVIAALSSAMELVTALGVDLSALGLPAWTCPEVE